MTNVTNHTNFQQFEDEAAELSTSNSHRFSNLDADWEDATTYSQEEVIAQLGISKGNSHDYYA